MLIIISYITGGKIRKTPLDNSFIFYDTDSANQHLKSNSTVCPAGEVPFGFGSDRVVSCMPNILEIYDLYSHKSLNEESLNRRKICLTGEPQSRSIGQVPHYCSGEYSEWGLSACYKPCQDGFSSNGVDLCSRNCPEGWTANGDLCNATRAVVLTGFCSGEYPNLYDGRCYKSGVQLPWGLTITPSGNCPTWYIDAGVSCWRGNPLVIKLKDKCPKDYDLNGTLCTGKSIPVSCPEDYFVQGQLCSLNMSKELIQGEEMITMKSSYPRESISHSCRENEENSNGLCYPKCQSGSKGVGPSCWQICPTHLVSCGVGCANDTKSCSEALQKQVVTPFLAFLQTTFLITTSGASAGLSDAALRAVTASREAAAAEEGLMISKLQNQAKEVDSAILARAFKVAADFLERITKKIILMNPAGSAAFKDCLKHYEDLNFCRTPADLVNTKKEVWLFKNCIEHNGEQKCMSNEEWIVFAKQTSNFAIGLYNIIEFVKDADSKPEDMAATARNNLNGVVGYVPSGLLSADTAFSYPICMALANSSSISISTTSTTTSAPSSPSSGSPFISTSKYFGVCFGLIAFVAFLAYAVYGAVSGGLSWTKVPATRLLQEPDEE